MRQGCFELLVFEGKGAQFDECELEGKFFVRAEPGKEYKVKFIIHRDASGKYPYEHLKCYLSVDDMYVDNYCFTLDPYYSYYQTIFSAFRLDSETIKAFTFSSVVVGDDKTLSNEATKTGLLQLTVYEAVPTEQEANPICCVTLPTPSNCTISENKKFWAQPSLATASGREVKELFNPAKFDYRLLRDFPDATLTIQCHTAGVLTILQDQHNKRHALLVKPVGIEPVHIDLSAEQDRSEPTAQLLPPTVYDLSHDAEPRREIAVKMENPRATIRRARNRCGTSVVDLTGDE